MAEWHTGWSAGAYANPIPNRWFLLLALSVPAGNLIQWLRLFAALPINRKLVTLANRLALTVSLGYSLLFLPIVPAALILSVFGVGLLPLAPFFAFHTAWHFRSGLPAQTPASLIPFLFGIPVLSTARRLLCQTTE